MPYQEDFNQWQEALESLPTNETKQPDRPVDVLAAQADTLLVEAQADKEALTAAGLDWKLVEDLNTLPGALRFCQAEWMSDYRARQEAQKQWNEKSPIAYELRDEMLHHFSFAYRKHNDINQKVKRIRDGNSHADMIQDLIELAVLAGKYPEPLAAINYDTGLNDKARTTSHEMAELLAMNNGAKDDSGKVKQLRDNAFTLLTERMREICAFGQYVFWKNPERKTKYVDSYN